MEAKNRKEKSRARDKKCWMEIRLKIGFRLRHKMFYLSAEYFKEDDASRNER